MIEVLKQMTEALEDFVDVIAYDNEQDDIGRRACCDVLSYNPHREDCKAIKSIASLRQAIAELESQEQNFCPRCGKRTNDIHTCTPPQRTEQEPQIAINAQVVGYVEPQRTWVGLTNEELTDLFYNTNLGQQSAVAQAIALLKEKNT
jgi:hypothetical protein